MVVVILLQLLDIMAEIIIHRVKTQWTQLAGWQAGVIKHNLGFVFVTNFFNGCHDQDKKANTNTVSDGKMNLELQIAVKG